MSALALVLVLATQAFCGNAAFRSMAEGIDAARELDLAVAADRFQSAVDDGCLEAEVTALYLRGLSAAVTATPGTPVAVEAEVVIRAAIEGLEARGGGQPGVVEISRLILESAAASVTGAYDAMTVFLGHAVNMSELQLAAGQPEAPVVSAFEAAGMLLHQAGRDELAREHFLRAETVVGRQPRVVSGLAATAMALADSAVACTEVRALLTWWGDRADPPAVVEDARAYLRDPGCL